MQLKWEAKLRISQVIPRPIVTIILYEKHYFMHNFGENVLQNTVLLWNFNFCPGRVAKKMMAPSNVS